jgi:HlyD family secretion protein
VSFSVDAFPDMEFSGQVNQVRLAPNEANNVVTYTVIITAANPELKLLPGMTAIVEIVTGKSENVLRVPNDAIRFKPATDSALAEKLKAVQADGGGGGPRGGPDMAVFKTSLGLDDATAREIETEVKALYAGMRAQFQAPGSGEGNIDRDAMREQMRQQVSAVFEKHLTPEQFQQYQQIRRQMAETRSGVLWVQRTSGDIEPVPVRLGIGDDNYTQVSGQGIGAGDLVVTRIRQAAK